MDISELIDEILERVDGDVVSSDPYTNRRILHSDLWNLVERYESEKPESELEYLETRNKELHDELEDLQEDYDFIASENRKLSGRLEELEAEDD